MFDQNFRGGLGRDAVIKTPPHVSPSEMELEQGKCELNGCVKKAGNYRCDEECNTLACGFDGNDCSLGVNPWRNCTASIQCWQVFMNGRCDEECNNAQCLFDGRDCEKNLQPCNPIYDAYCQKHYANGYCDYGCNNAECNWDGLDCEKEPPRLAEGAISVVVLMDLQAFQASLVSFLRDIGHQLRATVRVKSDMDGKNMIYAWKKDGSQGVIAYLEIDNRRCSISPGADCFSTANEAAGFLAATAQNHALSTSFPIVKVQGVSSAEPPLPEAPTSGKFVFIGIIMVTLVGLLLGVLVTAQRKRAHGITWFPEGFLRTNSGPRRRSRRRGPDGQEMRNLSKGAEVGGGGIVPPHWSDDEGDLPPAKRARDNGYASDHTAVTDYDDMWAHHVPDTRNVILTPPSMESQSVDVRGPCGMTPLMVAAVKGGGLDTGEEDEEDGTAAVIADLVAQGAELNATMDKTGETSLHLAARYARADAAKRLLDAGAEANSQDNTGRTPLHAAVAADAMGVFQILLRNRATNLNARMHDGTTPLILAARLAIEGMVEDLINADADINAADNSGKTALHWAAAVNNVDAVNILLSHGANRDAQDDKDETPLFLAAREGSFEACKALLDNFANREITDHMDRLPRDVASERLHSDIVRLLDEHVPRSPQVLSVVPNPQLLGSPNHPHLMTHPGVMSGPPVGGGKGTKGSTKKRGKTESPEGAGNGDTQQGVMRRKPSVKKKKEEDNSGGGGVYSSPGLPPPYEDCLKSLGEYQQYCSVTSPPASVSPAKGRPGLPTSPTHMAAMRAATQQALGFPYQLYQTGGGGGGQQGYYHYLTPPSEPAPESFPTPSPESPWHWSSSSPHSNSDWSEGISSPNNAKHHDAIYI